MNKSDAVDVYYSYGIAALPEGEPHKNPKLKVRTLLPWSFKLETDLSAETHLRVKALWLYIVRVARKLQY